MDENKVCPVNADRRSERKRKRKESYSPPPKTDATDKKKAKEPKPVRNSFANRPYDVLPNGVPFSCFLCKSPYVVNQRAKGVKKAGRSRHTPLPRLRIDQNTGAEILLCNSCVVIYDRPVRRVSRQVSSPTQDERKDYMAQAEFFAKSLRKDWDNPLVEKLFCPASQKKLCGCLQKYITTSLNAGEHDVVPRLLDLMKRAGDLRRQKFYSPTDTSSKRNIGLGNGHKKSKHYEAFVIEERRALREDARLCERATQKILMYSNNFLHKKLKTENRPCRIERTRGKGVLGKLPELHTMVDLHCCQDNCVMLALTHKCLLQDWRMRAQLGQADARRVLAEMLTPAGATHVNCYAFITMVTGCSAGTIARVYSHMLETGGLRDPPEHGLKKYWQEHYKSRVGDGITADDQTSTLTDQPAVRIIEKDSNLAKKTPLNLENLMEKMRETSNQWLLHAKQQLLQQQQPGGPGLRPGGPGLWPDGPGIQPCGPGMQPCGPGMQPCGPGMQPGGPVLQPGGTGMLPGGSGLQPSGPGLQPGGPVLQPGGPGLQHLPPGLPSQQPGFVLIPDQNASSSLHPNKDPAMMRLLNMPVKSATQTQLSHSVLAQQLSNPPLQPSYQAVNIPSFNQTATSHFQPLPYNVPPPKYNINQSNMDRQVNQSHVPFPIMHHPTVTPLPVVMNQSDRAPAGNGNQQFVSIQTAPQSLPSKLSNEQQVAVTVPLSQTSYQIPSDTVLPHYVIDGNYVSDVVDVVFTNMHPSKQATANASQIHGASNSTSCGEQAAGSFGMVTSDGAYSVKNTIPVSNTNISQTVFGASNLKDTAHTQTKLVQTQPVVELDSVPQSLQGQTDVITPVQLVDKNTGVTQLLYLISSGHGGAPDMVQAVPQTLLQSAEVGHQSVGMNLNLPNVCEHNKEASNLPVVVCVKQNGENIGTTRIDGDLQHHTHQITDLNHGLVPSQSAVLEDQDEKFPANATPSELHIKYESANAGENGQQLVQQIFLPNGDIVNLTLTPSLAASSDGYTSTPIAVVSENTAVCTDTVGMSSKSYISEPVGETGLAVQLSVNEYPGLGQNVTIGENTGPITSGIVLSVSPSPIPVIADSNSHSFGQGIVASATSGKIETYIAPSSNSAFDAVPFSGRFTEQTVNLPACEEGLPKQGMKMLGTKSSKGLESLDKCKEVKIQKPNRALKSRNSTVGSVKSRHPSGTSSIKSHNPVTASSVKSRTFSGASTIKSRNPSGASSIKSRNPSGASDISRRSITPHIGTKVSFEDMDALDLKGLHADAFFDYHVESRLKSSLARSRQASGNSEIGGRSRKSSGNSLMSETSGLNFSNISSPNIFFDKDKGVFFIQSIEGVDFSEIESSPTLDEMIRLSGLASVDPGTIQNQNDGRAECEDSGQPQHLTYEIVKQADAIKQQAGHHLINSNLSRIEEQFVHIETVDENRANSAVSNSRNVKIENIDGANPRHKTKGAMSRSSGGSKATSVKSKKTSVRKKKDAN